MRILTQDQRSTDWILERRGRITGSRIKDVLATLKRGGESETRAKYRRQLIAERTTGEVSSNYVTPEMDYGTEQEPYARAEYEIETGNFVNEVGFVLHPTFDFTGSSPDGLTGTDGALEIKVPRSETHVAWLEAAERQEEAGEPVTVPDEHEPQCMWALACTGRKWIDFVSFDPRQKQLERLLVIRMYRNEERIAQIEAEVAKFNEEIEARIAALRKRVKLSPALPKRSALEELNEMMEAGIIP